MLAFKDLLKEKTLNGTDGTWVLENASIHLSNLLLEPYKFYDYKYEFKRHAGVLGVL